jgi:hypothetical protein
VKTVFEMSDKELIDLYVDRGTEDLREEEIKYLFEKIDTETLSAKPLTLHKTASGEEKHITQMNRREIVELYLSQKKLNYSDELYMWEHSAYDIDKATKCKKPEELEEFLSSIEISYQW